MSGPGQQRIGFQLELRVLQVICQGALLGETEEAAARELFGTYEWQDPIHSLIFKSWLLLRDTSQETFREQLPAMLTRRGFPDVDLAPYFLSPEPTNKSLEDLVKDLKNSTY